MGILNILAVSTFVLGYIGITLEHQLKMNKSAFAILMGGTLWVLVSISGAEHISESFMHASAEIFEIVVFLLTAMSLVEVLVHYQFFDVLRGKIFSWGLDERKQFVVVSVLAFFLSAVIDNLTATIVMIQIARKFFKGKNLLVAAVSIVINANAGGAFSPLGDVTTIMLWLAGKFTAGKIILEGFLPSLTILFISLSMLYFRISDSKYDSKQDIVTKLTSCEKTVVALVFLSFGMPLVMSFLGLKPFLGLLMGLGIVWVVIDGFKQRSERKTHMEASLESFLQKTDIASLQFFIGILLAVSALDTLNLLDYISEFFYGDNPTFNRVVLGNVGLGLISPILDNVPLTAIAIKVLEITDTHLWVLLAITVGTGGSLLSIGSAAGVIAMGCLKELTFANYIKIGFIPALVGFAGAVIVWYLQYLIIA